MDSLASCPFCHLTVPPSELQRHANGHFEEEEDVVRIRQLARDLELAQHVSLSSTLKHNNHNQVDSNMNFDTTSPKTSQGTTSGSCCGDNSDGGSEWRIDEKISCLIGLQIRGSFYQMKGGLMPLLSNCLELEGETSTSILSGYVDHFQSIASEDVGWGCGWRNIQILSSHLLMQRQEAREVLFGGSGFVPDIPSLQRWLEIAWERGFDALGFHHFNHTIYGSTNWIGTTECAALFRSFGLRARIVDFGSKESGSLFLSVPGSSLGPQVTNAKGTRKAIQTFGPMDRYLVRRSPDVPHKNSIDSRNHLSDALAGTSTDNSANNFTRKSECHHILLDWVWKYFSDETLTLSGHHHVFYSDRSPLYFQHDGHSRTIVGIQVKCQQNGMQQYNLLVLDPAHRTTSLERSLKENAGWQKLIKRGVHTLKKTEYQLCYIDPGIARGVEMEQLKTIDSLFIEF